MREQGAQTEMTKIWKWEAILDLSLWRNKPEEDLKRFALQCVVHNPTPITYQTIH